MKKVACHAYAADKVVGIKPLSFVVVVVRDHTGGEEFREGFVNGERRLVVGGVYGHDVRRLASRPYQLVGGDDWTIPGGGLRAILADGTEVRMANAGNMRTYTAAGKEYPSVAAAALELTPHGD